ncbi:MAG: T9SS type A sorting domain-containing protein, partial [Saprospiraceae bacterium]|nr:T9SS type A sorting domain-containing protein [Saprospiraceae bacterium]
AASSTFTTTPPNDNVANATPITIGATCSGNAFSNRGATTEPSEPAPTCQSSYSRTVWYSFTPTTSSIFATTDLGTPTGMTDGVMSLFTGNPASFSTLAPVACDDDGGITNATMPVLSASVTPGQTYYLRVALYSTGAGGDYCLEVKEGETKVPSTSACATSYTTSITTALGNTNQWVSITGTSGDIVAAVNANGQNLGTVTVNVYTTTSIRTDALGQPYLNRNYRVTSGTLPASSVGVRLYFTDTEIADLIAHPSGGGTLADYNVTHVAGAACATAFAGTGSLITQSNSADLAGNTSYLEFTTPGFSAFYVNKGPLALPLQLISFTGKTLENSNMIEWETANEKNVANHIVERSADGIQWTEIGRKTGHADSDQRLKYQLEDLTPMAKSYYRLRSVDFDGQESVSKSILLTRRNDQFGITNLLPNPAFERVMVQFAAKEEGNVIVRITDINGRIVAEQSYEAIEGLNEAPVYLAQLQAGVYNVSITSGSEVSAPVRLIKQ